jgi:hypothetical protein
VVRPIAVRSADQRRELLPLRNLWYRSRAAVH